MTDLTPEALAALDREAREAAAPIDAALFGGAHPYFDEMLRCNEAVAALNDALRALYRAGKLVHVDAIKGDRHE